MGPSDGLYLIGPLIAIAGWAPLGNTWVRLGVIVLIFAGYGLRLFLKRRQAQRRNQRSTIAGVLAGLAGAAIGSDLVSRGLGYGAQLYSLGYSRSQEYEADGLGVRYSAAAGYDPQGMASMLAQLNAEQALSARIEGREQRLPGWASTHPNGAERVARARTLAAQTRGAAPAAAQDTAFLRALDGMRYDDNPAQGVVDGRSFRHSALRVRFTAPEGYQIANGTAAVTISGSGGQAQFGSATGSNDPAAVVRQRFAALGVSEQPTPEAMTVNGLAMAYALTRANVGGRAMDVTVAAYRLPGGTVHFTLVTPSGSGVGPFEAMLDSVAPLSAAEAGAVRGRVVRIHSVRAGDTVDSLARQMAYPDFQRVRFLTLNALAPDARLAPGRLVKLVVHS